jgi:prephenate dehydratase
MPESPGYIQRVLATLQNNPTAANLDFLVEAFTSLGYLAATAESDAETAEAQRKYDEATAAADVRTAALGKGVKITSAEVADKVTVLTWDSKRAEIKARERAAKLKNLLASVEQAINAIKFLGRYDSSINTGGRDRLPR